MRRNTFFGVAAFGIAGVFLAAPAANATDIGSLGFVDNNAKLGERIMAIGGCNAKGFTTAKLQSAVLEPSEVYLKDSGGEVPSLTGIAVVRKDAKPGTYAVSYMCGKTRVTYKLTIVGTVKKPSPTTPKPAGQVAIKPKGAADTGAGGTVAAQSDSGLGAGEFALGGMGLVAVAGAGVLGFRRLRKQS